tara:strand:+ start:199 stop:417 length:219 start_codon:yes stop_codon:yes gene_type:complete
MDKRTMKKKVREVIASFLVNALNDDYPHEGPNLIADIRLWVFKDPDNPTEAESRRLQNILFEMHREAHQYEV